MQDYCENQLSCRRQTFSDKFTETRVRLNRCSQCDNCKCQAGAARRTFLPPKVPANNALSLNTQQGSRKLSNSNSSVVSVGQKRSLASIDEEEEIDEDDHDVWLSATNRMAKKPADDVARKTGFVKASQYRNHSSITQSDKRELSHTVNDKCEGDNDSDPWINAAPVKPKPAFVKASALKGSLSNKTNTKSEYIDLL